MKNILGQTFGRLTVIQESGRNKFRQVLWRCRCECGNETIVPGGDLRSGHSSSCRCRLPENMKSVRDPHPKGERNGFAKLTDDDVISIRRTYASGDWTTRELAREFGLNHGHVADIIRGKRWSHLPL